MKRLYYLRFRPAAKIDYLHLLSFYNLAEYSNNNKVFNTIHYQSVRELASNLNISTATVNRILSNVEYKEFMFVDKKNKTITLHNTFIKGYSE